MKHLCIKIILLSLIICILASCQRPYDVNNEIESLNNMLKENNTNEEVYIDLFDAYVINGDYFDAIKIIDESLKHSEGIKTKELIDDLKDSYDVYGINNVFYKRILIDYDVNFDPFYEDKRNVDYYQGNYPLIGGNFDSAYYIDSYLTSNNQKLYKNSNYTIYLLAEEDVITDIYRYTYDIAGKNMASEDSFRQALYAALDIYRNRMRYREANANPLRKQYFDKGSDNEKLDLTKEEE